MYKIILFSFLAATTSFGSVYPRERPESLRNATLRCQLSAEKHLYLFQDEKKVLISNKKDEMVPIVLESFEIYRCPGCFGFVGFVDAHRYVGQTEGIYNDDTGQWDVIMDLTIDAGEQQRLNCFWRH